MDISMQRLHRSTSCIRLRQTVVTVSTETNKTALNIYIIFTTVSACYKVSVETSVELCLSKCSLIYYTVNAVYRTFHHSESRV